MRLRHVFVAAGTTVVVASAPAWAQFVVTDPATTGRNAAVAVLKNQILLAVRVQHERLREMSRRLSVDRDLRRYAASDAPDWEMHDAHAEALEWAAGYRAALASGDAFGRAYLQATRSRQDAHDVLERLDVGAREAITRGLATLDATDSANILGTHHVGALRANGESEQRAIDHLESDVVDPSNAQSATAVLDKISAAVLLETRQKQSRLAYLTSLLEHLVIENKRARDTEAAVLNMQVRRVQAAWSEGHEGLLTGAGDELRVWRQP